MKKLFLFFAVFLCVALLFADAGDVQDINACEYARKARKVSVWKEYLKSYPEGACKFEAQMKLEKAAKKKEKKKAKLKSVQNGDLEWSETAEFKADYEDAKAACDQINTKGDSGWHLPTIDELRTLIVDCPETESGGTCVVKNDDCIGCNRDREHSVFSDKGLFWSSTPYQRVNSNAWAVNFDYGSVTYIGRAGEHSFRCVKKKNSADVIKNLGEEDDEIDSDYEFENNKSKEGDMSIVNNEPVRYYRPYKGWGITLLVLGGIALTEIMPIMAYCADYQLHEDDDPDEYKKFKAAAIATGVIGGVFIISGAIITAVRRPVPRKNVEISNLSVAPTKGGAYASLGLEF